MNNSKTMKAALAAAVTVVMMTGGSVFAQAKPGATLDPHAGHNHAAPAATGGHAHGDAKDLGTTTIASLKVNVSQMGDVAAGGHGVFEITPAAGQTDPKAVRVWVGAENGVGSVKAKAAKAGDAYDAHVEVPKALTPESSLWVEVEPATGKKEKVGFTLKQ
ncbi:hypothetical protein CVU37_00745 [candidate division BRC1 bacterium HGW-BRC1-1]|jgi:hypothetical protein|nr:MAG: hypothetical protein CVU37_00745 [candidate division BRC1 bacterium HGW-BRC1-1]